MSNKEIILNIPHPASGASRNESKDMDEDEDEFPDEYEEGIGEFDDGRTGKLTLGVLLQEGLIEPAEGVMSIDYLGQTFKGDLLATGKIKSLETGLIFNNPSAWAIYCKQIINPAKKSGCGWASVKYKGRKMDHFKNLWLKMKAKRETEQEEKLNESISATLDNSDHNLNENGSGNPDGSSDNHLTKPAVLRHSQLATKHPMDNLNTLIEVDTFQGQGKIQPFNVSISSSSLLLIDLHSHLNLDPVCGYLAGQWDLNAHNLAITHVFPCLADLKDSSTAEETETKIYTDIYSRNLTLVGWYRSCPGLHALPSLKDTEAQLEYQMRLLGASDATYTPCVGLLGSPYTSGASEAETLVYWVVPPAETSPNEYGKPLKMVYTMVTDPCLSQEVLTLIETMISFYKSHPRVVPFRDQYNSDTKFITKMGRTILPKFPRDQDERLWRYIRVLILGPEESEIEDPLIIHPPLTGSSTAIQITQSNGGDVGNDEDEIDDDEEHALSVHPTSYHHDQMAQALDTGAAHLPATTEEVINLLLNQQAPLTPVAPPAHQTLHLPEHSGAPLDFSMNDSRDRDSYH